MSANPRQAVADSLHLFASPVPGLEPNRRRRTVFIRGGAVFWGFYLTWLVLKFTAIGLYLGVVFAMRFSIVLGALIAWGWASGAGVIQRRRHSIPTRTPTRP